MQRFLLPAILAACALGLSACGFTPLYASPGVSPGLSSIQVAAPDGRVGYLLRETLDDALPRDASRPVAYRLDVSIDESREPLGLRLDDVAKRYEVSLTVNYTLTDLSNGEVAKRGVATSFISYDAAEQPYAGIAARQDVQERVAAEVARKIRIDLAAYFSAKGG
ncbi:MAG: LPS assembly lipoprotein LptE [Caulobacteraceae bacterium]|jgi:LPS-assembly lipoprotein